MNTPNRTPRPWRAVDYLAAAELIEGPQGQTLAMRQDGASAADMRLMAAAPELLEALEELLEHIEWRRRTAGETTGPNDCTHRARVAIANATRPGSWGDA